MQCILYFNIHYWAWCVMLPMLCFVESSKQLLSVVVSASWPVCETTSPRAGNYGDGVFVSCLVTGFRTILILGTGQIHGVDFDWSRWSRDCTNVSVKIWTVLLLYCDDTVSQYCLRVQFRAFQAGMVQGRNAYINTSTVGWKTLELSGMTSCWVLPTWYRMVLLWNFNQSICDLVHHGQSAVESTSLQGFPSKIRHHRRHGNRRFAASKGNVLHKSGCSTLCLFQFINIFLLVWVQDV